MFGDLVYDDVVKPLVQQDQAKYKFQLGINFSIWWYAVKRLVQQDQAKCYTFCFIETFSDYS